jgi:hypothetical protein
VLSAVALLWLIEQDCVSPIVLMQTALFGFAAGAANDRRVVAARRVTCMTAQRAVLQRNLFLPPAAAICTTGWVASVHVQRRPGHLGPA